MSTPVEPGTVREEKISDAAIRLAGHGQDGIQAIGGFLARLAGRSGLEVTTFMTIPATVAGGDSVFQLRMGGEGVLTIGDEVDVLVVLHQDSHDAQIKNLRKGGLLLHEADQVVPAEGDFTPVAIPFDPLADAAMGGKGKGRNMVVMGVLARLFNLDVTKLRGLLAERFGKKDPSVLEKVNACFEAGLAFEVEATIGKLFRLPDGPSSAPARVVMDGNQAMAYGLITAGIRHGAGYPITPGTPIMEILRAELPKYGGVYLQTEDELAAICATIGMSYGGHLAVTATSGPGMSLKLEALSYATMAEIPIIVINVQRGGPSTGIPTQVEQSDLMQAIWGSHGDNPRPVLAARSVEDCFHICFEAVKLAREYSTPVVILSDQIMATRVEGFPLPDIDSLMTKYELDLSPRPADYKPYPADKITRHAPPGTRMEGGVYPTVTGLEHTEDGKPSPAPEVHMRMTAKRRQKILDIKAKLPAPEVYGDDEGVLLVGWGSTFGSIREAVMGLRAQGRKAAHLHLRHIHPLPPAVADIFNRYADVVVAEMNDQGLYGCGQLAMHLRAVTCNPKIRGLTKTDGLTFKVREVLAGVENRA